MPNKVASHKKNYSFILERNLISQVDAEAKRLNLNRTDIIKRAIREHLALDPISASKNDIEALKNEINELKQRNLAISQNFGKLIENQEQAKLLEQTKEKESGIKRVFKSS